MISPDIDGIKNRFSYDPVSGVLSKTKTGQSVGWKNGNGYISLSFNYKYYLAHRVAWLLSFGSWPDGLIDHRDGDTTNNRLENLRLATSKQNAQNQKARGYYYSPRHKQFYASIWVNNKSIFLGLHRSEDAARKAYLAAAKEHFGEFARLKNAEFVMSHSSGPRREDHGAVVPEVRIGNDPPK